MVSILLVFLKLHLIAGSIRAPFGKKFSMGTLFDHVTVIHLHNLVSILNRRQAMGND